MKKKKLILICIIILFIIGGCVQQLNGGNVPADSGAAPPVGRDDTAPLPDANNSMPKNSHDATRADSDKNSVAVAETEGLPAISGLEDELVEDKPDENKPVEHDSAAVGSNGDTENEALNENPELSKFPNIKFENRVYFVNMPELSNEYKFSSGLYTEQDLRLLSLMLQLIPSNTVNGVLKAFDSSVTPDINLTQFTYDDFADGRYSVSIDKTVAYYKEEGLALLSVTRSLEGQDKGIEYILVFSEAESGFYTPLSVICINPSDRFLQSPDRIVITNNEKIYLLTTGQVTDYENEKRIFTRLYDCDSGALVFSLPHKVTFNSGNLSENYSVKLKMDTLKNYPEGFTIDVTATAEHIISDSYFAPKGINLLLEQEITIFVSESYAYIEDNQATFIANFTQIKPWQYKTVFKDTINRLTKNSSTLVAQWATDMLNYNRNIAESSKLPEHELDLFKYGSSDEPHMHFTADDLYGIVSSIRNKEYSSLTGVLQNYSTSDNYDLSKFLQLKKFNWSRVSGNVECKLIFPDINMNYVLMEAKFNYRKKAVTVLLLLSGEENNSYYALADVQTTTIGEGDSLHYSASDDLLKLSLPSAEYAKATNSRYYFGGELALEILTGYTGPSGLYYTISLERDNMNGSLYYCSINAYLSPDVKAAVYELPVCFESNGSFTSDIDALKLLRGKPEEHEAFKLLLHDSLDKIAKSDYYHIEYRTEAENVLKYFGWL